MSAYPSTADERRVGARPLLEFATRVFAESAMSTADAALLADTLVAADLRGVHSHGVLRVPDYVAKLDGGGVDPAGRPEVVRDSGAVAVVDARNAMGQIAGAFAMDEAIARAQRHGVGAVGVRGSNHCGAMAYYALRAVERGLIGLATTHALPTMAPWGGLDKIVGINPLAIAAPGLDEPAMVLDIAFAGSSHGKIRIFSQKGLDIPAHWAFDDSGEPTTDAERALTGLLQPIGQFKGVGLAVMMGVLSSLLSGAGYGLETGNMVDGPTVGVDGHFFLALDVAAFGPVEEFRRRADAIVRELRESRRKDGVGALYAPGGLEAETEAQYRQDGIPLNAECLAGLRVAGERVGVAWDLT